MSYPGGKSGAGVFQTLINLMPPHDVYIEPFLGGGGVMWRKRPARVNVGIDLDGSVIDKARESAAPLDPARAAAIARNGEGRSPIAGNGYRGLGPWNFYQEDSIRFLQEFPPPPQALVYADPPYLLSTRVDGTARYAHELTDADHVRLISVLRSLPCMVMISGYSSALYAKHLKGWHATAFQAATRGKPAAEWVWCNFPRPVELHDYRFLGDDFRERERIKRMQKRWKGKLERMPLLQRQALLSAIADTAENSRASALSAMSSRQILCQQQPAPPSSSEKRKASGAPTQYPPRTTTQETSDTPRTRNTQETQTLSV